MEEKYKIPHKLQLSKRHIQFALIPILLEYVNDQITQKEAAKRIIWMSMFLSHANQIAYNEGDEKLEDHGEMGAVFNTILAIVRSTLQYHDKEIPNDVFITTKDEYEDLSNYWDKYEKSKDIAQDIADFYTQSQEYYEKKGV